MGPKGYYRRGTAYLALNRNKEALKDFTSLCKLAPNDKDAREKLKLCQKKVQTERFEKAIESEKSKPMSETFDFNSIAVDGSYDGPVYESGKITVEFCKELM